MKVLAAILLLATLAQSRPRHILVPYDDEIEQPKIQFIPLPQKYNDSMNYREARSAFPQDAQPAFAIPDGIRAAEELIAAGSGPSPAIAGGDAVDYGAYTGGYGAFGWYSDHPNHEGIGHRRRRRSPQDMIGAPLRYAPAPLAPSYDQYEADQALAGFTAYAKHPKGRVGSELRFRRSPQEEAALGAPLRYAPAPLASSNDQYEADQALAGSTTYAKHRKGRVGPVYTFVKTDPKANFKWGVRHVAGVQYGK